MLRVYMAPRPDQAIKDTTNSINAIVLRLQQHLPAFGVELVDDPNNADLIASHAGMAPEFKTGCVSIAHLHGLYPTAYADQVTGWHWQANALVVANILGARRVTVPSQWVADILRRDMHLEPDVIGWGVDLTEWQGANPQGYVLWNKTRTDGVCSPVPLAMLARLAPNVPFISTFAPNGTTQNVRVTGRVSYEQMREMIKGASVYLATTKETFGIGTLEAMACGIPVLGFRHGATPDLIEHGVNGYLVEPGDYDGLKEGLDYCYKYRSVLGQNARLAAAAYSWQNVARQFAEIYRKTLQTADEPRVSIVIPCYNYSAYVGDAIRSAAAQRMPDGGTVEIVVVDDGSTDNSKDVIWNTFQSIEGDRPLMKMITCENGGVAEARNRGIRSAHGEYIVCLDADDMIAPGFVDVCVRALDANHSLGIAFTSLQTMNESGQLGAVSVWPNGYDFNLAVKSHNQVPTCCMFRKEAWQRAGGFQKRYTPAEDAQLWLTIGSLGYRASHCTQQPLFLYRSHDNSLSESVRTGQKPEPNWRDKNWIRDGNRPFACDGTPGFYSWPVRNYDRPKISVVIPVGPYHTDYLAEAIDSIEQQLERNWELIIVNDSGRALRLDYCPYARVIETSGSCGPSYARNRGIEAAKAPLIAFLDADDVLHQDFLKETLKTYAVHHKYVYTDWVSLNKEGQYERHTTPEYDPNRVFQETSIHSINVLIERQQLIDVGMFDESMWSWEDTDLFMRLAKAGYCGVRCALPLTLYRYQTGQLRERGFDQQEELKQLLAERYSEYVKGEVNIVCCGQSVQAPLEIGALEPTQGVRILYTGPVGSMEVIGTATKRNYGRHQRGDIFYIFAADLQSQPQLFTPVIDPVEQIQVTPVPAEPTLKTA